MDSCTSAGTEPRWGALRYGAGVIIVLLGLLAVVFPLITGISVSVMLGMVLVIGALAHALIASRMGISVETLGTVLGRSILAIFYVFAGIVFMTNPTVGVATLTLLAIAFFLVDGLIEIAWGLRSRRQPGATWLLTSGGISLLLAGFLWPTTEQNRT